MNAVRQELRAAGRLLAAAPTAMFLAVLTVGFGMASAAQHMGLYDAAALGVRRPSVVLACPRTSPAKASAAGAQVAGAKSATTSPAAAGSAAPATANASLPADKHVVGRTGGRGLSVPLPDFNAPELSRFISPL